MGASTGDGSGWRNGPGSWSSSGTVLGSVPPLLSCYPAGLHPRCPWWSLTHKHPLLASLSVSLSPLIPLWLLESPLKPLAPKVLVLGFALGRVQTKTEGMQRAAYRSAEEGRPTTPGAWWKFTKQKLNQVRGKAGVGQVGGKAVRFQVEGLTGGKGYRPEEPWRAANSPKQWTVGSTSVGASVMPGVGGLRAAGPISAVFHSLASPFSISDRFTMSTHPTLPSSPNWCPLGKRQQLRSKCQLHSKSSEISHKCKNKTTFPL